MNETIIGNPPGFRDILFDEARTRRRVEQTLADVFEHIGYHEIVPAGVEYFDLYGRGHQSIKERAFRFLDRDDNLVALRADFTPAIARIVATRFTNSAPPFKMWYSGNVFRKVALQRGLFREASQIGAELVGVNSTTSDVEILSVANQCLTSLGISDIQLHVNHAGIFKGIVNSLGLGDHALDELKSVIDRKDARGLAARLRDIGASATVAAQIDALSRCIGGREVLTVARTIITSEESLAALDELEKIANDVHALDIDVTYDLTEIDEMEYYTGIMFTFFSPKLKAELGGGGRYDDLLAQFGAAMPAIGFSFSMERLVELV